MSQIMLDGIVKTFTVSKAPKGRFALLRGAFTRDRETVRALDGIGFSIGKGELVGYIGPNGAGKSTTVKVMSGILTPDSGSCVINGLIPWRQRVRHVAGIGVVFGQRSQLWWDVPARDSFDLLRDMYCINAADYKKRLTSLIDALEIGSLLQTPVRQLSLGQRMRCEAVAALLHSPDILFLDEPTIGLDASSKLSLREFLRGENRERGVTMILTTHDMDDIAALCHRVMVIGHGKLLFDGKMDELRQKYAPLRCVKAKTGGASARAEFAFAKKMVYENGSAEIWFDPLEITAQDAVAAVSGALAPWDLTIAEENADEMVARMYQELAL